jgi:hypothetical protein
MANKSNNKLTVYGTKRAKDQEPGIDYEYYTGYDFIGGPYSYVDKFYQDDAAEIIHRAKWSMNWRIKNAIDGKARIMVSDLRNGGKSFYGKARIAHVESKSGRIYEILISYNTAVCMLDSAGRFVRLWNGYSATTMKHIGAFMDCFKLRNIGKHEWLELPVGKPSRIAVA